MQCWSIFYICIIPVAHVLERILIGLTLQKHLSCNVTWMLYNSRLHIITYAIFWPTSVFSGFCLHTYTDKPQSGMGEHTNSFMNFSLIKSKVTTISNFTPCKYHLQNPSFSLEPNILRSPGTKSCENNLLKDVLCKVNFLWHLYLKHKSLYHSYNKISK